MTFPATALPIVQQLLINGVWTTFTTDTRASDAIRISRGYSGEQSQISPGSAQFTINNRAGKYTNKNPLSPYYRQLGRNTQYRTGVDTGVVSARFLDSVSAGTSTYDGSVIWTADKATLDITGDIDMAIDCDAEDWRGRNGFIFLSKYLIAGSQRSWLFGVDPYGYLIFTWSTDGTSANRIRAACPVAVNPTGRVQYRMQLDVDNGAGGWTCAFYVGVGPTINDAYTLIGSVSGAGVTSIFSGSARVEVGDANNGASWSATLSDADPFIGKIYSAHIRNGLNGTLVANANAYLQAAGTTSWVDTTTSTNTWAVAGSTYLSSADWRFWGEVPSLPNRWDISGTDIYIPTRSADILQRLTSGNSAKPLRSSVFRNLSQYAWDGYWPAEDATDATTIAAYVGDPGAKTSASFTGQPTDFPGTAGALSFTDDTGTAYGYCRASTGTPTITTFMAYFKFGTPPASATYVNWMNWYIAGGTASQVAFQVNNTQFLINIYDNTGATLVSLASTFGTNVSPGNWIAMRVQMTQSGGNVNWGMAWYQVRDQVIWGNSGSFAGTMGRPRSWQSPAFTGKSGLEIAHIAMGRFDPDFTSTIFTTATNAYIGESWAARARRLAAEQDVPLWIQGARSLAGDTSFIHLMGVQPLKSLVDLLRECATVAGGLLFAPRDKFGLTIRSYEAMLNGSGPQLDYAQGHLSGSLEPEPDDFLIENDVTLTIPDGTSYRYVKSTGTLNVQDPTASVDGVGTYDVTDTINLELSSDLERATERRVANGTWDEARFPTVQAQLERAPFLASASLTAQVRAVDLGRALAILNPPAWLPPGTISLLATGYVEILGAQTQTLTWNTRPAGPWTGGRWGDSTHSTTSLWGAQSTVLKTGVNTTAISLVFETTDVFEQWSTSVTGYQVEIAGERMTITAMGARTGTGPYDQTATVTRSVNGIVKSLSANEKVTVVAVGRWA